MLTIGSIVVDDDGNETFYPDDTTNSAKRLYLLLLSGATTMKSRKKAPLGSVQNADGSISVAGEVVVTATGQPVKFTWTLPQPGGRPPVVTTDNPIPQSARPALNPDGSTSIGGIVYRFADGTNNPLFPPSIFYTETKTITPDAATKQKTAEYATNIATWHVQDIVANAVITTTIPASSAGDGLQTSAAAGNPTTHPSSPKTLTGSIT